MNFVEFRVVSQINDGVLTLEPEPTHVPNALCQVVIIRCEVAAFKSIEKLACMEREALGFAETSNSDPEIGFIVGFYRVE